MFDCEAQRFPKGVLPLRSNPSVPLCLVSATPERLTVVAPGRRGSSQNVKMHHSGLFNSIASKPATNHLYPFIAKYRYSNVRQVLSENGETRKTSWFIIISPDKNCDNTPCFGQTHMIVHHCNQTSTVLSLHFGLRLQRECCSRTSATCKRRGSEWCKNMQKQHVLLSYITSMSWRKTENACSNTHLDVQLHLRMCVHPCILDIFCPMNIYSMPCNYAKKKTNRTVKQKTRWFPHPWPKLRTLGPRSLRQQFWKAWKGMRVVSLGACILRPVLPLFTAIKTSEVLWQMWRGNMFACLMSLNWNAGTTHVPCES